LRITASATSLNVADPVASAAFAKRHPRLRRGHGADGFVSLGRPDGVSGFA